ncbi:MAG: hypothetical protein NT002_10010 [candidate division Zixibacteria bacterium]|nr:hypothetical protein [candidate division Zixibacteria bacterium]
MSKNESLDRLFDDWRKHYANFGISVKDFSADGIIDEPSYDVAKKKVLFVLRETNSFPEGDLRTQLNKGPKWQLFHQVAKWAWGILNEFDDFEKINSSPIEMITAIKSIATMNVKKYTGRSVTDFSLLHAFVYLDKSFIAKEIEIIKPDIILCCNTFIELMWALDLKEVKQSLSNPKTAFEKYYSYTNSRVIPWKHHPADRRQHRKNYNDLKQLFKDIKL